ncbi:MAG: glycosyltransferase [Chitinophagaceae bacterium]|nr:glycosyltransferase [Chitinophagaceae bacterium]
MLLLLLIAFIFLVYAALMLYYYRGWQRIPRFSIPADIVFDKTVSVLIPVRNEAANITRLLQCLQQQSYPRHLVQIILINDNSTDNTRALAEAFADVDIIDLDSSVTHSHKKKAIEAGIKIARGEWIVTTDGDCYMDKNWLSNIIAFQQNTNASYIAAPVVIDAGTSLVQRFQQMDFAVLQGVTGVSVNERLHAMSNGANQAYSKAIFHEVGGYSGVDHTASGDDLFLLQKINQHLPQSVAYLCSKDAIVSTAAVNTWREFFQQRIRWASKAKYYKEGKIWMVMLSVYLLNLSFPLLLFAGIFNYNYLLAALVLWISKTIIEWPFVNRVFRFFGLPFSFIGFFLFQPLHMLYTVISGFLGFVRRYEWKGRVG